MKMIVGDPSSIPVGVKFSFLVLQKLVFRSSGAWNFVILVMDFEIGGLSFVAVRMEYLFAYQFWYWELWVENLWGGERKHYFVNFFPAGVLLIPVAEGWCSWFYIAVSSYKFHALKIYPHSKFTVRPIGGGFGMQSNIYGGAFFQK